MSFVLKPPPVPHSNIIHALVGADKVTVRDVLEIDRHGIVGIQIQAEFKAGVEEDV